MREAEKKNKFFVIDNWFFTIYTSKFCDESLSTLEHDMTFAEFAELSDQVLFYTELEEAAEIKNWNDPLRIHLILIPLIRLLMNTNNVNASNEVAMELANASPP